MAFTVIPGLAADDISIQLPAQGDTDWAVNLRELAFKKIAQHDHSGSGNGQPIAGSGLAADSIIGNKILLNNAEYLRWKNAAGTATDIIRFAADDKIELAQQIDLLNLSNNVSLTGRNAANSANIDIVKVDASDDIAFGAEISAAKLKQNTFLTGRNAADDGDVNIAKIDSLDRVNLSDTLLLGGSDTLTDNTAVAATVTNFPVPATDSFVFAMYKAVRNGDVEFGQLTIDADNASIVQERSGDSIGVTFSNDAGTLKYITTSTGFNVTLTYIVIKA